MYAPWPEAVLRQPAFGEVRDADGRLLFRGPR
jgi:hypothetical protein